MSIQFDPGEAKGMPRLPPAFVEEGAFEASFDGPARFYHVLSLEQPIEYRRRFRRRLRKTEKVRLSTLLVQIISGDLDEKEASEWAEGAPYSVSLDQLLRRERPYLESLDVRIFRPKERAILDRDHIDDVDDLVGLGLGTVRRAK